MKPRPILFNEPSQGPRLTLCDKLKLWRALKKMDLTKLKSRKLWVTAAVAAITVVLNGVGFDEELTGNLVDVVTALKPQAPSPKPEA